MLTRLCGLLRWCATAAAILLLAGCVQGETHQAATPRADASPSPTFAPPAPAQTQVAATPLAWQATWPSVSASSTPLPTATPLSVRTAISAGSSSPSVVPLRIATPAQPSPTPRPAVYPAWATGTIRVAADLLNARHGDAEAVPGEIVRLAGRSTPAAQGVPEWNGWAKKVDLDADGREELVIAVPATDQEAFPWMSQARVVLFTDQSGTYVPAYLFSIAAPGAPGESLEDPEFLAAEDLDRDGRTELALTTTSCGAHT